MIKSSLRSFSGFLLLMFLLPVFVSVSETEASGKPVAIMGMGSTVVEEILKPEGIQYEVLEEWLPATSYGDYSVIFLAERMRGVSGVEGGMLWAEPEVSEEVEKYLNEGGIVIITCVGFEALGRSRNLESVSHLLGFAYHPRYPEGRRPTRVIISRKDSPLMADLTENEYQWVAPYIVPISRVSTAEVLAIQLDEEGEILAPFITVNRVGEGKVYWFASSLFRLARARAFDSEEVETYRSVILRAILEGNPSRPYREQEEEEE